MTSQKRVIAEYNFESIIDNQTNDISCNGHSAEIVGARLQSTSVGNALTFDGISNYVDCGKINKSPLEAFSVECWVRPDNNPAGETGIAGTGTLGFELAMSGSGWQCCWVVASQIAAFASLEVGQWQHVAGTYDGKTASLYVNGSLAGSANVVNPVELHKNFLLGAISSQKGFFNGAISRVKLYNYVLSSKEISDSILIQHLENQHKFTSITDGESIEFDNFKILVGKSGGIQVDVNSESYSIITQMSFPGDTIGWNCLGSVDKPDNIKIIKNNNKQIMVLCEYSNYKFIRDITLENHRIFVKDKIENKTADDIGIYYKNILLASGSFTQRLLGGADKSSTRMTAENPSVFVGLSKSNLAWLAEDNIYRLQLEMASSANSVTMSANNFALKSGSSYEFCWALYPKPEKSDYWDFINITRRDWDVNFRLIGPWTQLDITARRDIFGNPDAMKEYLNLNKSQVIAFAPWLDYDNYNALTNKPMTRSEFKELAQEAMALVKSINPEIKCIGCMEGNLVSLPMEITDAFHSLASNKSANQYFFNENQMHEIKKYNIRWKDCLLVNREGKYRYELYYRGKNGELPMVAAAIIPALLNAQNEYWLDQARFMIEEIGLDGIYIDQFNLAFNDQQRYSYDRWDGVTVDIDPTTGKIKDRYTDGALVSAGAQKSLAEYVLGKNKYMLANTFPAVNEVQSLRIHRFVESEWVFNPFSWEDGEKPPLESYPCKGHLSVPISLGYKPSRLGKKGFDNYAKVVVKAAIAYLRHGLLYYHKRNDILGVDIPEDANDWYGPFNHMFPITPIEIGEGFVIGKERIVSCISGLFNWQCQKEPQVFVFDIMGKPTKFDSSIIKTENGYTIELHIADWSEIAIIE